MARFDLDWLHSLVMVADCGSLTAAAPLLCRSQSAVSEQIRKLEVFYQQPLLIRGKQGVRLTPAGERLLPGARRLLAESENLSREIRGEALGGDLRLALTDYFRPLEIAALLKQLRQSYPRLRLHVTIRPSASIQEDTRRGDFDLGLTMRLPGQEHQAGDLELYREPLYWVAADSVLACEPLPLILMTEHCTLHRFTLETLSQHGLRYQVDHSAAGVAGLQLALRAGLGLSCLNESALPGGVTRLGPENNLPALPEVAFTLLTGPNGNTGMIAKARDLLAGTLARTSAARHAFDGDH